MNLLKKIVKVMKNNFHKEPRCEHPTLRFARAATKRECAIYEDLAIFEDKPFVSGMHSNYYPAMWVCKDCGEFIFGFYTIPSMRYTPSYVVRNAHHAYKETEKKEAKNDYKRDN